MSFEDAIKHLREGKSIRRPDWMPDAIVCIKAGMFHYPHNGLSIKSMYFNVNDIQANDWEIVQ